ncbi:MotA/TolQ/ExbB proton channel family protein [Sinorhizobium americanum]|uniref:MotA/TolQ/ExbB proton channel family protein n=1 Tax=Sinorhizobium americanum TaxID=194963 RepID=A0A1L3LQS8_9HYPH|nr:MotA/TolQ/ExbB proton channel family protein [Sinorhizobium americanum CCGM7]APG92462.1 MotA/TolQ/ExbB proton channel family protein [Sinorhizobium americanum]
MVSGHRRHLWLAIAIDFENDPLLQRVAATGACADKRKSVPQTGRLANA